MTTETAILLSRALGTTPELWPNLHVAVEQCGYAVLPDGPRHTTARFPM